MGKSTTKWKPNRSQDGSVRLVRHHPEAVRNDVAEWIKGEADSVRSIDHGLAEIVDNIADAVRSMPVHRVPPPDAGRELTIAFIGPSGTGKSVTAGYLAKLLRANGFNVKHVEEPCSLTISDGTRHLGTHLANLWMRRNEV